MIGTTTTLRQKGLVVLHTDIVFVSIIKDILRRLFVETLLSYIVLKLKSTT